VYLSTHSSVGCNLDDAQALLVEHNEFKSSSKVFKLSLLNILSIWLFPWTVYLINIYLYYDF